MSGSQHDVASLLPHEDHSRREFFAAKLAAGFAPAVQPVSAQTIHTPADGLLAGEVRIKTKDIEIPAYRAMPATGSKLPVVLVVQEIFGVHEHIKDICRRFARQGYFALAPEMFVRQGDVAGITSIPDIIAKVVSKVPDAQVMADLDAAVSYAQSTGKVDPGKLAITGFCWGGRVVWLYAAHSPKLKAGVAWYGRLTGQSSQLTPKQPVDVAGDLKAPVLGLYGGQDQGIPQDSIEAMRAALKAAGRKDSEVIVYPDAPHGFNADYRPSYNARDARDGWRRLLEFFQKHGAA